MDFSISAIFPELASSSHAKLFGIFLFYYFNYTSFVKLKTLTIKYMRGKQGADDNLEILVNG